MKRYNENSVLKPKYDWWYFLLWCLYMFIIINGSWDSSRFWFLEFLSYNAFQIIISIMAITILLMKIQEQKYDELLQVYEHSVNEKGNRNPYLIPFNKKAKKEIIKIKRWKRGKTHIQFINFCLIVILSIVKFKLTF